MPRDLRSTYPDQSVEGTMVHLSRAMLIAALGLCACTTDSPSRPGFVAAEGKKSFAEFRQDDTDCRESAAARDGAGRATTTIPPAPTGSRASPQRDDARYTECLRAKGYRIEPRLAAYPLITTGVLPVDGGNR
jgi:hypothetical protein